MLYTFRKKTSDKLTSEKTSSLRGVWCVSQKGSQVRWLERLSQTQLAGISGENTMFRHGLASWRGRKSLHYDCDKCRWAAGIWFSPGMDCVMLLSHHRFLTYLCVVQKSLSFSLYFLSLSFLPPQTLVRNWRKREERRMKTLIVIMFCYHRENQCNREQLSSTTKQR